MQNNVQKTETTQKDVKATTASKKEEPKLVTVVSVIEDVYSKFQKDIETGTKLVMAKLKELGQTHNVRGEKIEAGKVSALTKAFIRDINKPRPGKWDELKVVVDEKQGIKIVPKTQA